MDMYDSMSSTNYTTPTEITSNEESGWTSYIQEFITENNGVQEDSDSASPSLSLRRTHGNRITKPGFLDHDLEDTATSPLHSPKVADDFNHLHIKYKTIDDQDLFQEIKKGEEGINLAIVEAELRRKGLCLVPMSMLFNLSS